MANDRRDEQDPRASNPQASDPRASGRQLDSRVESRASQRSTEGTGENPFASPSGTRPPSSYDAASYVNMSNMVERLPGGQRYFKSRRVRKGEVEKPWALKKNPKEKWVTIIPLIGVLIGLGISGFLIWDGIRSVVKHKYCLVLDEDWSQGIRDNVWQREIQLGGFGNGEFQQTTRENAYVEDGKLIIKATLQDDKLLLSDSKIDLLSSGECTSTAFANCVAATNTTAGNSSIVPPVLSARLNTRPGASIKYGRVEVTARMPEGDWLWPAIWMMPVNSTYGVWPQSGEIDLAESRGNNYTYPQGGNDIISSTLHWGPSPASDAFWRTNVKRRALHTTFANKFHTFGMEWSEKYLFTYIDSRLLQVMYVNFHKQSMFQRGNFPQVENNTRTVDPWGHTGRLNTPFDQKFYLILNVAVGGTNGWFEDQVMGKPWVDGSTNAKKDFWQAKDQWFPTWTRPQMEVGRVVMWQQCDGHEGDDL